MHIKKTKGFTFIEIMMTLLLLVMLSLFAYPSVKTQLAKNEANQTHRILNMGFKQGKTMSYANKKTVSLCFLNKNGDCSNKDGQRLILFYDDNNSKSYEKETDTLLEQYEIKPSYGHVDLNAGKRHLLQFWQNTGTPRGYFGHVKYCSHVDEAYSFQFSFSQTGRVTYKPSTEYATGC